MQFDKTKLEFDFEKMMDIPEVKEMAREKNGTAVFFYPFGETEKQITDFLSFKVTSNAYPNLVDYGICRYKCGKSYYHATYFITGQTKRGKMMREKIQSGQIKVGRKALKDRKAKATAAKTP